MAAAAAHPTQLAAAGESTWQRLAQTLSRRGPWVVAGVFLFYAGQWLAVIGFLPTLLRQVGTPTWQVGLAGAGAAAVNMIGNLGAGRLQQRGVRPQVIVAMACTVMALGANGFYAEGWPLPLRLAAVAAFSLFGGLIPATLFTLAVRVAPSPQTTGTTVGWMQQGSAMGQFFGPPAVAWAAAHTGGWAAAGWVTATAAMLALLLMRMLPADALHAANPPATR
jgi:predicted MFS family arabinose efflux permease